MRRPAGVTVIAVLGVLALLTVGEGLLLLIRGGAVFAPGMSFYSGGAWAGIVLLGGAVLVIVTCVGLLKLQQWARVLAIVLNAVHLILAASGLLDALRNIHMAFFVGVLFRHVVMLAIGIWIIVYLIQAKVKQAFPPPALAAS
ncbi:MAG: hypothetical protein WBQ34_17555 [Candidatus Acidiferrales bacterium]